MVNIILTALKVFGNFKHYERIRDGNPPPLTKVGLEVYLKYKRLIMIQLTYISNKLTSQPCKIKFYDFLILFCYKNHFILAEFRRKALFMTIIWY